MLVLLPRFRKAQRICILSSTKPPVQRAQCTTSLHRTSTPLTLPPCLPALFSLADVSNPEEIELDDDFVDDDGETQQQRRQQQQGGGVDPALAAVLGGGGGGAAAVAAPNPEEIDIGDE